MDADDILVLKEGRIAERGTHARLLTVPDGIYADMWHKQTVESIQDETTTTTTTTMTTTTTTAGA